MSNSPRARPVEAAADNQQGIVALESLARGARQVSLYGREHPIAVSALKEACRDLLAESHEGPVEIQAEEGGLLWGGTSLPTHSEHVVRFHAAMRDRLIAVIRFDPDIRPHDLAQLLMLMDEDVERLIAAGGAMRGLAQAGSLSIRIEDIDFTAELRESESAWMESCLELDPDASGGMKDILESCLHTVSALGGDGAGDRRQASPLSAEGAFSEEAAAAAEASTPEEAVATTIARMIQHTGETAKFVDEHHWQGWLDNTAQRLEALGPEWRARIFRAASDTGRGHLEVLACVARGMYPEACVSLVLDHPDSIRFERSEGLGRVLARIMPDAERANLVEPLLHRSAIAHGVSEEVYQNVVGVLLLEIRSSKEAGHPVLGAGSAPEAGRSARPDEELADLLETTARQAVGISRLQMLLELLESELTVNQYGGVLRLVVDAAQECTERGDAEGLVEILQSLRRQADDATSKDHGKQAMATSALARSGSANVIGLIVNEIEKNKGEVRDELVTLLGHLGDEGMRGLVDIARRKGNSGFARAVAMIVESDNAHLSYLRRVISEVAENDLSRLLQLLIEIDDSRLGEQLDIVVHHPSATARLGLVHVIRQSKAPAAAETLLRLLSDRVPTVRLAAINAVVDLKFRKATAALCEVIRNEAAFGEGANVREAAVIALGSIGDSTAVSTLGDVLY
ncbi:MAG: HEAT repeat domain-containing protein, partial [Proteobacteria bacterium]|nr:HEAT repeat domain-containing protein [Pseudomonadota bacterium]